MSSKYGAPVQTIRYNQNANGSQYDTEPIIYVMEVPEIIIIFFIICLWLLSIRIFVKKFERIRTTHYREIPYSYRYQPPLNANQIRVVKRETDSIIISNKKASTDLTLDEFEINSVSGSPYSTRKKSSIRILTDDSTTIPNPSNYLYKEINVNFCNKDNYNYLNNLSSLKYHRPSSPALLVHFDSSPKQRYSVTQSSNMDMRLTSMSKAVEKKQQKSSLNFSTHINPTLIPDVVRRSLLDLHRKSVENVLMNTTGNRTNLDHRRYHNKSICAMMQTMPTNPADFIESPV